MKSFFIKLSLGLIFIFLASCGGGGGNDSSSASNGCGSLNAKIFGGEVCSRDARTSVVAIVPILLDGSRVVGLGSCSGALVTVDDILTSAHCFIEPIFEARQLGLDIEFGLLVGGAGSGEILGLVNAQVHPLYDGVPGSPFDVAMATLEKVPSPPIGPLPLLVSEISLPGDPITAFGYGRDDNTDIDVRILKSADFVIDRAEGGNLISVGDGSASICPGDSGGPAVYRTSNGISTLAGVNSFIDIRGGACVSTAARTFGFVDVQFPTILDFVIGYAPDVALG